MLGTATSVSTSTRLMDPVSRIRSITRAQVRAAIGPIVILVVGSALAVVLYSHYLTHHRLLWKDVTHDRHAHLFSGLSITTDLQHGRLGQLASDYDKFRTWPPLHDGILLPIALLLGKNDPNWAVLPSLIAWVLTALFAFLLARRALPTGGNIAGGLAALMILVSPAMRAFATDIMLESTGACLTVMCLYFFLVVVQDNSRRSMAAFALALTALFLTKYNYWALVVLGFAAYALIAHRERLRAWAMEIWTQAPLRPRIVRLLRSPWTYAVAIPALASVALALVGGTAITVAGRSVSVRSGANLLTLAYGILFFRIALWYWRTGHARVRENGPIVQAIVHWHLFPMAIWFLWPRRLYSILWVLNPNSNIGEAPSFDLLSGYASYWEALVEDYHISVWSLATVLGLLAIAFLASRRGKLRPGASMILCFTLVAFLLCANHPNRKSRFLHSWIPMMWVSAGIGAAALLQVRRLTRYSPGRLGVVTLSGILGVAHMPALLDPAHAPEGGIQLWRKSTLTISETYLPHLAQSNRTAIFSNLPMKFLAQWTHLQQYPHRPRPETDIKNLNAFTPAPCPAFDAWIASTPCDTLVHVEILPESPFIASIPGAEDLRHCKSLLEGQTVFRKTHRERHPEYGFVVTIWRRPDASTTGRQVRNQNGEAQQESTR